MDNIRVTYSGLIAFVVGIISVFTGMVFVLIVTRTLTVEEFGAWSLIGSMIVYFLISERLVSFWTTRHIARGENIGRTSLFTTIVFSLASIPAYLGISYIVATNSNADFEILVLGIGLIPVFFISDTLASINTGHKPQATSFSLLIFESSKIPFALGLVYFLDLGVAGAIFATLAAYTIRIIVQGYFAKIKLSEHFSKDLLKRWIRLSWIPLYGNIMKFLKSLDVFLYSIIIGSVVGVAFFSAATSISLLVLHANRISQAVYPKLLANGSHDYIKENFTRLLYFLIPLFAITVIFAKPAMYALNPQYEEAYTVAIILTFKMFFEVLNITLNKTLLGIENVDVETKPKFRDLLKSNLFLVNTRNNIQYVFYIVLMVSLILILNSNDSPELELVTWWALVALILEIPFFFYMWRLVQKRVKFSFPYVNFLKYCGSASVFVIFYFLLSPEIIQYHESIFDFLPPVLGLLLMCVAIYLSMTYLIDKKTRTLFHAIISEIK